MPYIKPEARAKLDAELVELSFSIATAGELNYAITRLVAMYLHMQPVNYARLAEVSGVLSNVNSELYRRIAAPFEDRKMAEHGDVY